MSNKLIFWIIVIIAGAGLLISANIFRDEFPNPGSISEATPVPILSPTPSEEQNRGPSISQPSSPKSGEIGASCQISGKIKFINANLYETIGAKIIYQNVDDEIRQIYWKPSPDDGALSVGPNLFEGLEIPNGEREIGVVLKGKPATESYILTASITYGVKQPSGAVEEKIVDCAGTISVDVSGI